MKFPKPPGNKDLYQTFLRFSGEGRPFNSPVIVKISILHPEGFYFSKRHSRRFLFFAKCDKDTVIHRFPFFTVEDSLYILRFLGLLFDFLSCSLHPSQRRENP